MSTAEPQPTPPVTGFRYSLRTLMLITTGIAIIFSLYPVGGPMALGTVLLVGALVGVGFVVLVRRRLRWLSLVVFVGAMLGGIVAGELAFYVGSLDAQKLNAPESTHYNHMQPIVLTRWAIGGALAGAVAGVIMGWWLAARSGVREEESTLRWYQPTKGALLGLLLLAGLDAWFEYGEYRHRKRMEAFDAVKEMGGSVEYEPFSKDGVNRDAVEVDVRNCQITDAGLKYIITLNPQRRLRLGKSTVTEEGMKKLRHALPNCEVDWEPQPGDGRQNRAATD